MRYKNTYIYPVFGSQQQRRFHFIIYHQIRRRCIYVTICTVDHIDMRVFPYIFFIGWRITVWLHIAVIANIRKYPEIRLIIEYIILFFFIIIPELQKHQRQIPYRFTANHDTAILPVPKAFFLIDILIRQIDTACHSHLAVNDKNFSMISIIHLHGKPRLNWIKHLRLYTKSA